MGLFGKSSGKPAEDPLALIQSGRFKEAISLLQAKLKREPHDVTTRRRLAEAYEGAGRGKDAAAIYRLEGESCLASGDRPKGLAFLKKAAKVDPADESIQARIAGLEDPGSGDDGDNFSFDMGTDEEPAATVPIPAVAANAVSPVTPPPPPNPPPPPEEEETGFAMDSPSQQQVALEEAAEAVDAGEELAGPTAPEAELEPELEPELERDLEIETELVALEALPEEELVPESLPEPLEVLPAVELAPEPLPEPLEEMPVEALPLPEDGLDPFAIGGVEPSSPESGFTATRPAESDEVGLMLGAFPGLDAMDVMELIACFGCMTLQPGEVLLREGEAGESVYLVIRGKLVAKAVLNGQEIELASLSRGDVLGEVSFLHNVPRTATVIALESTVVLEMPGASAKEQLAAMPHIKDRLEALIAERVEHTVTLVKERMREHPQR